MAKKPLLPIKVVVPSDGDYERPLARGSTKEFVEVTPSLRRQIVREIDKVEEYFFRDQKFRPNLPRVARIVLRGEATAKSHRPSRLFNGETCPPCGFGGGDEFYATVTRHGLMALRVNVLTDDTKEGRANISTILRICPWTSKDALGQEEEEAVMQRVRASRSGLLRIRLFRHRREYQNEAIVRAIEESAGSELISMDYGSGSPYFAVAARSASMIRALALLC